MGGTNQGERASGGLTPYAPLQLLKQARGQIEATSFDHSRKRLLQCMRPLLAHRVDSLRCEGLDAIGAKRTCRERRERVDLTKMTLSGPEGARNAAAHRAPDLILATHRGARNRMPRRHR